MENKFIGHESWKKQYPNGTDLDYKTFLEDKEVLVLRPILFFYKDQKTTLSQIRVNFTDHAIAKLVSDKFIEIKGK
jgi:hypothetical protein